MHSTLVRAQNVFGFFTTVMAVIAGLIALSSFVSPQTPSASVKLQNVQVVRGRPHYWSSKREEYAHIKFDLDMDLSSIFNWNTKQVFVYITATYPSLKASEPPSQAIIWDAILASPSAPWHQNHYVHPQPKSSSSKSSKNNKAASLYPPGELHLEKQRPKYQITDYSGRIANRTDAVLELGWSVQPWVGLLTWADWPPVHGGLWKKLDGGKSKTFNFPALKAKKEGDTGTAKGRERNKEGEFF
ncbi:signal peptidase 22 kDa subunit [Saccharata proteae CBS 121410]|uniref:Signal peptidase subunit 3 n=1 Tax=Saccharata proteae CBS 121410 TaxID=1314787 RepID=A0A9P4LXG8_9PEZI|nr:signal peptidase 22 kDa subunit [Saccharata proteae CBS 121410]